MPELHHAAVFLDRDGTIIEDVGWLARSADLKLYPGAAEAIARLNRSEYKTVVVTNQSVIARGNLTEAQLAVIHADLAAMLSAQNAHWDALYFCPHHPSAGAPGVRPDLRVACDCRKPGIGMITQAARETNLDLGDSWLIGDTTSDMMTAKRAGLRSVLVHTGAAGADGTWPVLPDLERPSLVEAIDLVLSGWPRLMAEARQHTEAILPGSVVLVAGLARSGKSSFAAALAAALREEGKAAVVVPLDCWLKDAEARPHAPVLDRFDTSAIMAFARDALAAHGTKRIPRYDRRTRRSVPHGIELDVPASSVLVVEGVPALAIPALRLLAAHSFYVKREEDNRLAAMTADYRWRGWADDDIAALVTARAEDELPFIEPTEMYADVVLHDVAGV